MNNKLFLILVTAALLDVIIIVLCLKIKLDLNRIKLIQTKYKLNRVKHLISK